MGPPIPCVSGCSVASRPCAAASHAPRAGHDRLWPGSMRSAATNSFHQVLRAARYLSFQDEQLALCPGDPLWVDVEAFEHAVSTASRPTEPGAYEAALDLYPGDLLPEDRYEECSGKGTGSLSCQTFSAIGAASPIGYVAISEGVTVTPSPGRSWIFRGWRGRAARSARSDQPLSSGRNPGPRSSPRAGRPTSP